MRIVPVIVSKPPVKKIVGMPRLSIIILEIMGEMVIPRLHPVSVKPNKEPTPKPNITAIFKVPM
jgi:hypothetical protein